MQGFVSEPVTMETGLWVPPRSGGRHSPGPLAGGSGALARACVSLYPRCRVIVFDIPGVVQMAKTHFSAWEDERISFHEGGCLERCLCPRGNRRVLAGWGDGDAGRSAWLSGPSKHTPLKWSFPVAQR